MDRKDFLKGLGLATAGVVLAPAIIKSKEVMDEPSNQDILGGCTTIPSETAGPYPVPSSVSTSSLIRSNITENTQTGIPLTLTLTIVNVDNSCLPLSNLRVDIWHCNQRGYYSAYDNQPGIDGTQNFAGTTWLRGIQYTDSNGQVTFTSIYPGWYTPRATHIHVEIFNGTTLLMTTQLAFPDSINTTVNAYYATSGQNSFTNTNDMVFSDSYTNELMTVTGDTANGYIATKEIGINAGSLGIGIDTETGGQFSNLAALPNPFSDNTTVSFELIRMSDVQLNIMDISGRLIYTIDQSRMNSGRQEIPVNFTAQGLAAGTYLIQLQVSNENGTFRQTKKIVKL